MDIDEPEFLYPRPRRAQGGPDPVQARLAALRAERIRQREEERRHRRAELHPWRRAGWALGGLIVLLLVVAFAIDSSRSDQIAPGVHVDGVNVGGMTVPRARAVIARHIAPQLERPLVASAEGKRFVLSAHQAGVHANVDAIAHQALDESRGGWFVGRAFDTVLGNSLQLDLTPHITYSRAAVDGFVTQVARSLDHAPRNATVSFGESGPDPVPAQPGVTVQTAALRSSVEGALASSGSRTVRVPALLTPAKVNEGQLAAMYPAAVVVDRPHFQLKLYKHLQLAKTYPVAIGMQGLETPAGLYHVQEKQVNPSWSVPKSSWAGSLAGHVIPPGPQDPIKARWIGFDGSAGIHGTDETDSIGTAGSHGCVRMLIPDVIALYPQVQVGDPVYVA